MARLIRTEKEVEGRREEVWLVVEEDALEQWPAGPLEVARDLWLTWGEEGPGSHRSPAGRLTFRLIHLADIEAVTAAV